MPAIAQIRARLIAAATKSLTQKSHLLNACFVRKFARHGDKNKNFLRNHSHFL
jgi:hypothetical protein